MNTKALRQKILDLAIHVACDKPHYPFELPKGWEWTTVGEISWDLVYGTSKKSSSNGEIPVLRMGNINRCGKIDWNNLVYTSDKDDITKYSLQTNDLLFNRTNSNEWVGKTAIYKGEKTAIYAGYIVRLRVIILDADYVNFVMNSSYYRGWCNDVKTDAVNQSNINAQKLSHFFIPIPPLNEQKRIVNELSSWLNIIEATFELPKGWEWTTLGEIGEIITGNTPSKDNKEYYGGNIPFFKPTDLEQGIDTKFSNDKLSQLGFESSRKLPANTVLVTCIGATIGKTGLISVEGSCNQQINAIVPTKSIIPYFLYYACVSEYMQNEIKSNASATTLPILNKGNFSKIAFPLPPLSEQHRIVAKIEELFAQLDKIEASL
ncbi:MAG: restriction endonuclease subunit S [Prevotella sp.]|nr:restriction endonuclease subunit S [Prevotella sp.]